jgi:hypothetical protein
LIADRGLDLSVQPWFPAESLDADETDPALHSLAMRSAGALFNVNTNSIGVDAFPPAVRASIGLNAPIPCKLPGAVETPLLECLRKWLEWTTTDNRPGLPWDPSASRGNGLPFVLPIAGGIEEAGTAMVLQDMLLASTGRGPRMVLRLFPVWRTASGGPASFVGLRAKGGFIVSAAYDNTTDTVGPFNITSEAGLPCAVVSPWGKATLVEVREVGTASTVSVEWDRADRRGPIFRFNTSAGQAYTVATLPPPFSSVSGTNRSSLDRDSQ